MLEQREKKKTSNGLQLVKQQLVVTHAVRQTWDSRIATQWCCTNTGLFEMLNPQKTYGFFLCFRKKTWHALSDGLTEDLAGFVLFSVKLYIGGLRQIAVPWAPFILDRLLYFSNILVLVIQTHDVFWEARTRPMNIIFVEFKLQGRSSAVVRVRIWPSECWYLRWTICHWDRDFSDNFGYTLSVSFHQLSLLNFVLIPPFIRRRSGRSWGDFEQSGALIWFSPSIGQKAISQCLRMPKSYDEWTRAPGGTSCHRVTALWLG
jgi:hypothetical protein